MAQERTRSWPKALGRGWLSALRQLIGRGDQVPGSVRTVSVAFLANLVVAAAKYVGFFVSGSSALLAESMHSTAVTINQGLLLRGVLRSERPATREHQFGFGQERYFWSFVVATVMFGIGSVVSIGRGAIALDAEHAESSPAWALGALTVGLLMDGWSFVVAARQTHKDKGSLSYWRYLNRSHDAEVPVVLLEDSAAMVGLFFAYVGVGLTAALGSELYDALASILIGILLAIVAFILARKMKSLLVGESAPPEEREQIDEVITGHPCVDEVVYVRTLYLGPSDLLVESKAVFASDLGHDQVAAAIDEIEDEVRRRLPQARIIAVEPDNPGEGPSESPGYDRAVGD